MGLKSQNVASGQYFLGMYMSETCDEILCYSCLCYSVLVWLAVCLCRHFSWDDSHGSTAVLL